MEQLFAHDGIELVEEGAQLGELLPVGFDKLPDGYELFPGFVVLGARGEDLGAGAVVEGEHVGH